MGLILSYFLVPTIRIYCNKYNKRGGYAMKYEKPELLATFTQEQIVNQQQELEAEGWSLWMSK